MLEVQKKNFAVEYLISVACIALFAIFLFADGVNAIRFQAIGYDEGYNATVAANFMRHGEYRVSYPAEIPFYNIITTGETVILPTAFLYKVFGINAVTSSLIALIYGTMSILVIWRLFYKSFFGKKGAAIVALIGTIFLVLSDSYFARISTHLIGEGAALFFLIVASIFLLDYTEKNKAYYIFGAGGMVAFSFLTKSSMIFFVITFAGLMLWEIYVCKTVSRRHGIFYFLGFFAGFVLLDSFKLVQLGLKNYVLWWINEWKNMINQSSGIDITYSIKDKICYLEEIFNGSNKYFCLFMILLPIVIYALRFIAMFRDHRDASRSKRNRPLSMGMLFVGMGGTSLLVYFILLGGRGLIYARRHEVNGIAVRIFSLYILGLMVLKLIELLNDESLNNAKQVRRIMISTLIAGVCFFLICPIQVVKRNVISYVDKEIDYEYKAKLMNEFINEVAELEHDAVLYCVGWWQEPNISLYLDRKISDILSGVKPEENSYLVVGGLILGTTISDIENIANAKLIRIDCSEVDYTLYPIDSRNDFEVFAIYKMVPTLDMQK